MTSGKLTHLSGAHQVHALAAQIAKNLLGQIDGDRSYGNSGGCDGRLIAYALGHGEGARQQRIQLRIYGSDGSRRSVRFLYLPQNLRLADHHRVQARSYAEDVPHGVVVTEFVEVLAVGRGIEAVEIAQEPVQARTAVGGTRQDLHPIAGGDDHAFFHTGTGGQSSDGVRQARFRDGKLLTHIHGRGAVVDADQDEVQDGMNLWTRLKVFAAHAPMAITKAMVARNAARRPRHPELQRVYSSSM